MIKELLEDAERRMDQAVEHTQGELATIRTGRASPAILSRVNVEYYGAPTPLQQLASFTVPEPRMLLVTPFDANSIPEIERGINEAQLGLTPSNDGRVIRLVFPQLTEERRKELIRMTRNIGEEGRVAIRQVRRHTKDGIESLGGETSEDDVRRAEKELQDATDRHTGRIDELLEHKEHELLEV